MTTDTQKQEIAAASIAINPLTPCACIRPQNGDPLCPCLMRNGAPYQGLGPALLSDCATKGILHYSPFDSNSSTRTTTNKKDFA